VYTRGSEPILKRDAIIVNRKESLWRLLDEQDRGQEENIITNAIKNGRKLILQHPQDIHSAFSNLFFWVKIPA
jgi:hypothetical protein